MVLRRRQASNHMLSTTDNQSTRELKGQFILTSLFPPKRIELNLFIVKCFEWNTSIGPQAKHDQQPKYLRNGVYKYVHPILFLPVCCKNVLKMTWCWIWKIVWMKWKIYLTLDQALGLHSIKLNLEKHSTLD